MLRDKLTKALEQEWKSVREEVADRKEAGEGVGWNEEWEEAVRDEDVLVEVSERDRDPFGIVILQASTQVGKKIS